MSFIVDKQTLADLNLLGKFRSDSIFSFFNQVHTKGGEKFLEKLFHNPLTDAAAINRRSLTFQYFQTSGLVFPFGSEQVQAMDQYLHETEAQALFLNGIDLVRKHLLSFAVKDEGYQIALDRLQATIEVITGLNRFLSSFDGPDQDHPFYEQLSRVKQIMNDQRLNHFKNEALTVRKLQLTEVIRFTNIFTSQLNGEMKILLKFIYELDVYLTVSGLAKSKGFSYAQAEGAESNSYEAKELRHPLLEKAVANSLSIRAENNLIFLTGANMAGKSTLMKTLGISMYLAHMGFPIAAKSLKFSVKNGIYSSINVPDNLNMGYSHFYAEVLRVKQVAEEVSRGKNLLVIFDELFKGTNVKDAYDATLSVTKAFAAYRNCTFVISTHIIEVGEALQEQEAGMQFLYLPTLLEGRIPRYTYKLQQGISSDRQGMMIIEQEGILELFSKQKQPHK